MKLFFITITLFAVSSVYGQTTYETNTHDIRPQQYVPQLPPDNLMYRALEAKQREYDQNAQRQSQGHPQQSSNSVNTPNTTPAYNSHFDSRRGHSLYFVKRHPHYYSN